MTLPVEHARRLALLTALARTALGAVAMLAPGVPLAPWVGDARRDPAARLLGRALGARDLALGLGCLMAFRHEAPMRGWVEAGGLADTGDVMATLGSFRALPRPGRWAVLAAAAGGVAAARLASPSVDGPNFPVDETPRT